jgi:hypothetical protein
LAFGCVFVSVDAFRAEVDVKLCELGVDFDDAAFDLVDVAVGFAFLTLTDYLRGR